MAVWTGNANILARYGGILNILEGGVFDAQNNQQIYWNNNGSIPWIYNAGTFRKSGGSGRTTIRVALENSGTFDIQTGSIFVDEPGGGSSSGAILVAENASFELNSDFTLNDGATATGVGVVEILRRTTTVNGAVSFERLNLGSATVDGPGNLTVTERFDWTAGELTGAGILTMGADATFAISGSAQKDLNGRAVNHAGTVEWTGSGNILARNGAVFNNLAGALFDVQNNQSFYFNVNGGTPAFNNMGTLRKSAGTGTSTFDVQMNNTSLLDVQSGVVRLTRGGNSTGDHIVAGSAELDFGGGTHAITLGATRSLSGAGTARFSGATVTIDGEGTYHPATTVVSGGTAQFNRDVSSDHLVLSGGALAGAAVFTVGQAMTWTGGKLDGGGALELGEGVTLEISGNSQKDLSDRIVNLAGTAVWKDSGNILARYGGVFNILEEGLLEAEGNQKLYWNFNGSAPRLNNMGTFRKKAGTGSSTLEVDLRNSGTIDVQTGKVYLNQLGGGSSSGAFTVADGATVEFSVSFTLEEGATSSGLGYVEITEGTTTIAGTVSLERLRLGSAIIDGPGNLTVTKRFEWTNGRVTGAGDLNIGSEAVLALSGNAQKDIDGRRVNNSGMAVWTDSGNILARNGAVFNNLEGAVFEAKNDRSLTYNFNGSVPAFNNSGTLRKSAGTGISVIDANVMQSGEVDAASGTIRFARAFTQTGGSTVLNGGAITGSAGLLIDGGILRGGEPLPAM